MDSIVSTNEKSLFTVKSILCCRGTTSSFIGKLIKRRGKWYFIYLINETPTLKCSKIRFIHLVVCAGKHPVFYYHKYSKYRIYTNMLGSSWHLFVQLYLDKEYTFEKHIYIKNKTAISYLFPDNNLFVPI